MPQDAPVKPISIVGLILVLLGIVSLVYFESPLGLMVQAVAQHQNSPLPPILGLAAVIVGVALLAAGRPRG
jgi:multidrug transporter EmrE-like cation transporter